MTQITKMHISSKQAEEYEKSGLIPQFMEICSDCIYEMPHDKEICHECKKVELDAEHGTTYSKSGVFIVQQYFVKYYNYKRISDYRKKKIL